MADVWLIRHGQSEVNAGQKSADPASIALTDLGRRQARATAEQIAQRPAKIVVSPYVRSQQTAEALQRRFPDVPLVEWPVQEFTYLPTTEFHQTNAVERVDLVNAYWSAARPYRVLGPGAESFAQFIERVTDIRDRLVAATESPIAVFSHKKFMSALIWIVLVGDPKISRRRMLRYRGFDQGLSIKNGAIVPLALGATDCRLMVIQTAHLAGV